VLVEECSKIESSVILPDVTIGKNCSINHAVIDRGCEIPDGMIIGKDNEEDSKRFHVSPKGVVLVTPDMLGQKIHQVI
jgi:glucose-1-phosphate adenylyltransferase